MRRSVAAIDTERFFSRVIDVARQYFFDRQIVSQCAYPEFERGQIFGLSSFILLCLLSIGAEPACAQVNQDSVIALLKDRFGFSTGDLYAIDHRDIVTKELAAENSYEVAVCGAMRVRVPFAAALKSYAEMDAFKKDPNVPENGRFSPAPRMEDLAGLTLEEEDYKALKDCRTGDCKIKLPGETMLRFRKEIDWNSDSGATNALLQVKNNYVKYISAYRARGDSALMKYDDMDYPQTRVEEYEGLLAESPSLADWGKDLYRSLAGNAPFTDSSSTISGHIFWQKEIFEGAKPTTMINQLMIYRPLPDQPFALIGSKQLYADHFFEASLSVTALVGFPGDTSGIYVLYLNRSNYDDLRKGGIFSFSGRIRDAIVKQVKRDLVWTRERIMALGPVAGKEK